MKTANQNSMKAIDNSTIRKASAEGVVYHKHSSTRLFSAYLRGDKSKGEDFIASVKKDIEDRKEIID